MYTGVMIISKCPGGLCFFEPFRSRVTADGVYIDDLTVGHPRLKERQPIIK